MDNKLKKSLVDVPVLLIFFTRPDTLTEVFKKVKEARPSKLFLACDGPRKGTDDLEKINICKKIVEDIDWECEIHKNYASENMGCGERPKSAISWALSIVDRVIILEDDCVPNISFFSFAAELLEKYKDDERVGTISGLNHFKDWDCNGNSYFFTKNGAIWGWATWRRVWEKYDYSVSQINDPYTERLIYENLSGNKKTKRSKIERFKETYKKIEAGEKISYWDFQFGFLKITSSYLQIVPAHNQITNIGVGFGSTHFSGVKQKKWEPGTLYFMPSETIEIPLRHPACIMCDISYTNKVDRVFGYPNFVRKNYRRVKRLLRKIWSNIGR